MLYRWTRDLHLYLGLFISPFLLLFAGSVFFLNHAKVAPAQWSRVEAVHNLRVPDNLGQLRGRDAAAAAREILRQLGLRGEVGFTRFASRTRRFFFTVTTPGFEANVDVDAAAGTATVSSRTLGIWERLAYLHKMPGPHNVEIRGNWGPTRAWGVLADATIYMTLFITLSGVYLWWSLRAERRVGLAMLSAGVATLAGLAYVILR